MDGPEVPRSKNFEGRSDERVAVQIQEYQGISRVVAIEDTDRS
jgi:hypothetical protein